MRFQVVFRYVGIVILINSFFLLISSAISAIHFDAAFYPLFYTCLISFLFGIFPLIFVPATEDISNNEGFMIVISSWLLSCLIGLLPYVLWGGEFTFVNAWFESVSGFTTTGSSILTDIEALPLGLLFWRSSTHFIGGIGIILFALSVLPSMGKTGMVLYKTELSDLAMDNFQYRARKVISILLYVYIGLTVLETVALLFCGMNLFDAVTHSFGTIATGGFSPKNQSVGYYNSVSIESVIMVFMVLSGMHFGLLFIAVTGSFKKLWKSSIVRYYLIIQAVAIIAVAFNIHEEYFETWGPALRHAAFQVISIGTSTGFATADSSIWPSLSKLILIFFTLQCACAGSTSGGIKVDRIVMFWKVFLKRLKKVEHTQAVLRVRIDDITVDDEVVETGILYISLYIIIVFISSVILTALGVDGLSAFSGSAATMGNVGPGFGTVGSTGNFSQIPDLGKLTLTITMLLGRLEIFGLILFFLPRIWKMPFLKRERKESDISKLIGLRTSSPKRS